MYVHDYQCIIRVTTATVVLKKVSVIMCCWTW